MPGLIAFGRRWEIASDDLMFPALIESVIRLIWVITIIAIWAYHAPYLICDNAKSLHMYLGVALGLVVLIMINTIWLTRSSMRGAIMDVRARSSVTWLIYLRVLFGAFELGWTIFGTVWVFQKDQLCQESKWTLIMVKVIIIFNWLLTLLFVIGTFMVFDPLGHHHDPNELSSPSAKRLDHVFQKRTRIWEWRCKFLCCSCFPCCSCSGDQLESTSNHNAYGDVSGILASLFHDLDLVPTDIAAGLLLLHLRIKRNREVMRSKRSSQYQPVTEAPRLSAEVLTSSPASEAALRAEFSPSAVSIPPSAACSPNGVDNVMHQIGRIMIDSPLAAARAQEGLDQSWMNPYNAHVYMKYAFASYGWMWYLAGGGWLKGMATLSKKLVCCSCCRRKSSRRVADNCCECNLAALKTVTNLQEKDILHVSFHNSVFQVPYFVAIDHETSSIVVAIRGTLSADDALTDLAAVTDTITVEGLPVGWTAHRGMLQAAMFLFKQLAKNGILEEAAARHPDYHLVITGHSLGAGAAVLLSLFLKTRYPELRCFAFSPPGGLLSLAAARFTETFCMSVIVGDDLVPRLSLATMDLLKKQMVAELTACRHPKYRIFATGCWEVLFNKKATCDNTHPLLSDVPNNSLSYESFSDNRVNLQSPTDDVANEVAVNLSQQLYLPGRILQVEERLQDDSMNFSDEQSPVYEARWMQRDDYNQILVTPRMLADHTPDNVIRILRGLAIQHESAMSTSVNA